MESKTTNRKQLQTKINITPTISVITLNVNGVNVAIKTPRLPNG